MSKTGWKRRVRNIALGVLDVLTVAVIAVVAYVKARADRRFEVPTTKLAASRDPAIIARGEYLFHGPMHCTACHVGGGESVYRAAKPGDKLPASGGQEWKMGPLGTLRAPNITADPETGIGGRSDEHLARVIKHGVREDGRLSPFMSMAVATVDDEDIRAVISYVRSLAPVKNPVPPSELGFLAQALTAFGVFKARMTQAPAFVREDDSPSVERGKYLAHGPALCAGCHSPYDVFGGMVLEGPLFSGCLQADPAKGDPTKEICAPNLTLHPATGRLANWTEDVFVARMKTGVGPRESIMPWLNYAAMTDSDLRSIYRYIASVPHADRQTGPSVREKGWKP